MEYAIQTNQITKEYQNKLLLNSVDISIKQGEIYGFLGANGAGKTTLMKIITNLIRPSSGEVKILGELIQPNSYKYLHKIGAIIEKPAFIEELSGIDNLKFHCSYMGFHQKDAISNTLCLLKMEQYAAKKTKTYSLGMKQRLGLAQAIIHKPSILILDEPLNGLDPEGIKDIRELLKMLAHDYGISIMISSHILSELEIIAETVGIIKQGTLINQLSMAEIKNMNKQYYVLNTCDTQKAALVISQTLNIDNFKIIDENTIRIYNESINKNELIATLCQHNILIDGIYSKTGNLEDYFFNQTETGDIHD